jgi:hypothetical protein
MVRYIELDVVQGGVDLNARAYRTLTHHPSATGGE